MNWLTVGGTAIITALIAYGLHSFDVNRIEKNHADALVAQAGKLNSDCTLAKNITTGVDYGLHQNLLNLDTDAAALDGLFRNACATNPASMAGSAASGNDGAAAGQEPAERIVRTFEPSRVTAIVKKGEKYRVQLLACQSYVRQVQEAAIGR